LQYISFSTYSNYILIAQSLPAKIKTKKLYNKCCDFDETQNIYYRAFII